MKCDPNEVSLAKIDEEIQAVVQKFARTQKAYLWATRRESHLILSKDFRQCTLPVVVLDYTARGFTYGPRFLLPKRIIS